jgi:phenylalanyl-tRNA synthetase beta chain
LTALLPLIQLGKEFHPLPRFPGSVRDLALVVDKNVPAKSLMSIIQSSPLVSQVKLFDLYTGEAISAGKKSLAFRIAYQSPTHTLTDEEVNQAEAEILHHLSEETSAELRH